MKTTPTRSTGWGGRRTGAGRKPEAHGLKVLRGTAQGRRGPLMASVPVPVKVPAGLTAAERAVWDQLAPHALAARTLTPGTARGFADLCRYRVLLDSFSQSDKRGGSDHRGLAKLVLAGMKDFALEPFGKPVMLEDAPATPEDPFAAFDGAVN